MALSDTTAAVAAASGAVLSVLGVLGALYRFVLVPNLRRELIDPVQETARQVTGDPDPAVSTMRDDLDSVRWEVRTMARMFDGHLNWSQGEVDRLWAELRRQRATGARPDTRYPRHKGWSDDDNPDDPNGD